MTIRARLALWYGALVALILFAALSVAYFAHIGAHVRELESQIPSMDAEAVAEARARLDASASELRSEFMWIAGVGLIVALAGGWIVAWRALLPVASLTEAARAIGASRRSSRRVPAVDRRDELGELARTFNEMLESLDAAYGSQQRSVADASHELRTPLATIQGNAELLETDAVDEAERAEAVRQIRRESRRLARLIDDLLVLARADAGPEPFHATEVHLDEVLMEVFDELRPVAGRRLRVTSLEAAVVRGERDRLKQLVLILLDNALRYTPGDRPVEAGLALDGRAALLRIDDEGVGMAANELPHAFERFYRGQEARRLDPGGTGLGLSIARWIVERHGGEIELVPRTVMGTRALVRLPQAA